MKNNKSKKMFVGVVGIFVILVITVNVLTNDHEEKENETLSRLQTNTDTYSSDTYSSDTYSSNNYSSNTYSSKTCKYTDIELTVYAEHLVEEKLKNPKSAHFSNVEVVKASDEILVTGKVEATNSFGAVVSNGFIVTFEADGSATGDVIFTE